MSSATAAGGASQGPSARAQEEGSIALRTGVRLHYVARGEGPLLILLHGFPEHWYAWRHMIGPLAAEGYRVVAPDMRGYNTSDKPRAVEDYYAETLGDDVAALIEALGAERAIVVGHDWGGAAAWLLAMRHPERVERLVVMNMPHPAVFAEAWGTLRQRLRSAYFYFFRMRSLAAFVFRRMNALPQRLMLWWFSGRAPRWRDLEPYARAALQPGAMKAMMSYYTALLDREPEALLAFVRPIDLPVRVLWGTEDPAFGEALADPGPYVDRGQLAIVKLPGLGHFLHLHDPPRVLQALREALTSPADPTLLRAGLESRGRIRR